jgi:hypothetical protein
MQSEQHEVIKFLFFIRNIMLKVINLKNYNKLIRAISIYFKIRSLLRIHQRTIKDFRYYNGSS